MDKLVYIRKKQFLTQRELATLTGMSPSTINRIEKGLQKPTFKTIKALARALKVEPSDIYF